MFYLLWGLINISVFIFFIFTCFRATRLLRKQLGLWAAIIFVAGLLSFMSPRQTDTGKQDQHSDRKREGYFTGTDSVDAHTIKSIDLVLEKNWFSRYKLHIRYGRAAITGEYAPAYAYSTTIGTVSGTEWKPGIVWIGKTADPGKLQYEVEGTVEWSLLGMTVYHQHKTYKGIAAIQ